MPLPEHQESSPQPSEAKADDGKRTEWKVVSIVRSSHEITPVRSATVLSKSPPRLSRSSSSHVDVPDSDDDDDDELPESIPSMSRGPSLQSSASSTASRSNSFHHSSPSFTSTTSIPIPSTSSPMILSSSPPHHHPVFGGGLPGFSSLLSDSNPDHPHSHATLTQDPDDLSDSDDELPPTEPNFGLGPGIQSPPSGDSDELPPILSDDDDFPPAPTLMRQTGYYKGSTSHGCSCLEPEERTETDSYMYSR